MKEFTLHSAQKSALLKNALFEEIYIENCDLTKFRTAGRPAVPKLFLYSVCGAYTERSSRDGTESMMMEAHVASTAVQMKLRNVNKRVVPVIE